MFNTVFKRPDTVETYNSAPLTDEWLSFLHHIRDCGNGKSSLRCHARSQLRLVRLLEMTGRQSVSVARIETALHSATGKSGFPRQTSADTIRTFVANAVRWMRFLGWLEEPESVRHPHAAEVDAWVDWMHLDRGFSQSTIDRSRKVVDAFFNRLAPSGTLLSAITISDIDRVFAAWHAESQLCRSTRNVYARITRAFFRFAESRNLCRYRHNHCDVTLANCLQKNSD